jgi:hypothetical protein
MTVSLSRKLLAALFAIVVVVGATTVGVGAVGGTGGASAEPDTEAGPTPTVETAPADVSDGSDAGALEVPPTIGPVDVDDDGGNVSVANAAPTADAGPNHTATAGTQVSLNATRSSDPDGDALSYRWEQVGGPVVEPVGVRSPDMTFTPFDGYAGETITFEVTVTDPAGLNDTDRVSTRIVGENSSQSTVDRVGFDYGDYGGNVNIEVNGDFYNLERLSNLPGTVGGVPVQVTTANVSGGVQGHVELSGDVQSLAVGGQELFLDNVEFGPASGPHANVTFRNVTPVQRNYTVTETFTADGVPVTVENFTWSGGTVYAGGQAEVQSRVVPNAGGTSPEVYPDNANLRFDVGTVAEAAPQTPTADAGRDRAAAPSDQVTLNGAGSSDPNRDPLNYTWRQVAGPNATLVDANYPTPYVVAPSVSSVRTLTFELTVADPGGNVDADRVNVTVGPTGVAGTSVARVGFDYGEYGGTLNLEINGDFRNFDRYNRPPPVGVDGAMIGGVQVQVTNRSVAGGQQGHVELVGNVSSLALGGQELYVDNVEFGVGTTPRANVTFDNLTPARASYPVGASVTADGVPVTVESFTYADGTVTNGSQAVRRNATPTQAGGVAPEIYPDNVNLRFDVAAAATTGTEPLDVGIEIQQEATVQQGGTATVSSFVNNRANTPVTNATLELRVDANADGQFNASEVVTTEQVSLAGDAIREIDSDYRSVTLSPGDYAYQSRLVADGRSVTSFTNGTLTVTANETVGTGAVSRVGFDYGEYGGTLNLEVNGDFRTFDQFSSAPPDGVNDTTIGGANVTVQVRNATGGGTLGHVEIVGNVSSLAVGGQELWLDNVEFGPPASPSANVSFDTLSPRRTEYRVNDTFTADGVPVTVENFTTAAGGTTAGFGAPDNATPPMSGGYGTDFNTNNVNLRFDVAAVANATARNRAPIADAGADRTVTSGASVTLDASGSSDPDTDPLQYDWIQIDGPAVSLSGSDSAAPSFTAPVVTTPRTLTFELLVRDGVGGSDTDTVTVTVEPPAGANTTTTATVLLQEAPNGLFSYGVDLSASNETLLELEPRLTPALRVTAGGVGESAATVRSVDPSNRTYDEPIALLTATFTGNLSTEDVGLTVTNLTDDDRRDMNRSLVSLRVGGANPFPNGIPGATGDAPPGNIDDDPAYEDITGDGRFTFVDVIAFVFALDAIQSANLDAQARARLDHSGDGDVNFVDVIDLVFQL